MNPSIVLRWISLGILGCAASAYAAQSEWVYPGTDGKLVYKTTPLGDRIMDFSYAGYMGGGVALPDVPVKQTVKPSGDHDDTALIQKAIDQVSALALQNGFRGTVLLESGSYNCAGTITISADGVVLRGNDATVNLIGRPHLAISVRKAGAYRRRPSFDDEPETNSNDQRDSFQTSVSDTYVPSGTLCFHVASAAHLAVGDDIIIRKPVTQAWVKFMHMDDLVRDGRPQTWIRSPGYIITQRKIAAISGNEITLDVPLTDSLDARYLNPPGASVLKAAAPTEVSQVGLESLHIQCPPQSFNHDQQHFVAIRMDGQDCWIRDTVADETMDSIGVNGRRITLERVTVNRKALHTGSSKPAEFAPMQLRCCWIAAPFTPTTFGSPPPVRNKLARSCCSIARSPETATPNRISAGRPEFCTTTARRRRAESRCAIAARWARGTVGRWAGASCGTAPPKIISCKIRRGRSTGSSDASATISWRRSRSAKAPISRKARSIRPDSRFRPEVCI